MRVVYVRSFLFDYGKCQLRRSHLQDVDVPLIILQVKKRFCKVNVIQSIRFFFETNLPNWSYRINMGAHIYSFYYYLMGIAYYFIMVNDIPVDSESSVVSSISRYIGRSFEGTCMTRVWVFAFRVRAHMLCTCVCICLYHISRKKKKGFCQMQPIKCWVLLFCPYILKDQ